MIPTCVSQGGDYTDKADPWFLDAARVSKDGGSKDSIFAFWEDHGARLLGKVCNYPYLFYNFNIDFRTCLIALALTVTRQV